MALKTNREAFRDSSLFIPYAVKKDVATGLPVLGADSLATFDLTGAKFYFTVKRAYAESDANAVVQASIANAGVTLTDEDEGEMTVLVAPTAWALRLSGDGVWNLVYDLKMVEAGGRVSVLEYGKLTLYPSVGRVTT
jgi:hypothetical protein